MLALLCFFVLGSAIDPRPGSLFCNKMLIFSSLESLVPFFSEAGCAFYLQWSGSSPAGDSLALPLGMQEVVHRHPRAGCCLCPPLVSCLPVKSVPARYFMMVLWRECFIKLSEVPRSCRKADKETKGRFECCLWGFGSLSCGRGAGQEETIPG